MASFRWLTSPSATRSVLCSLASTRFTLPALQEAFQQFSKPTRKRGLALTDSATVAIQYRDIEQACMYVSEVVDIVEMGSSDFLRKEMSKLRRQLKPFSETASVKTLEQKLRVLA